MPRNTNDWPYNVNYEVLERLTGKRRASLHQDHSRGEFNPEDIASMAVYLARNGVMELRMAMVVAALRDDVMNNPKLKGMTRNANKPVRRKKTS